MSFKEYIYRKQHHGLSFVELLGVWLGLLGLSYFIIRSIITFV